MKVAHTHLPGDSSSKNDTNKSYEKRSGGFRNIVFTVLILGAIGGGGFDVLSAPPTSPAPQGGDVYWDDDEAIPYIYYDQGGGVANWIPLVPTQNPKTAEGGGSDEIFHENDQTVTTSYTIATGRNALSAGPITINTGATVTVSAGSTWVIV